MKGGGCPQEGITRGVLPRIRQSLVSKVEIRVSVYPRRIAMSFSTYYDSIEPRPRSAEQDLLRDKEKLDHAEDRLSEATSVDDIDFWLDELEARRRIVDQRLYIINLRNGIPDDRAACQGKASPPALRFIALSSVGVLALETPS